MKSLAGLDFHETIPISLLYPKPARIMLQTKLHNPLTEHRAQTRVPAQTVLQSANSSETQGRWSMSKSNLSWLLALAVLSVTAVDQAQARIVSKTTKIEPLGVRSTTVRTGPFSQRRVIRSTLKRPNGRVIHSKTIIGPGHRVRARQW